MFRPQDRMIVFFLGLLFFSRSDVVLPEETKGDYPDANKEFYTLTEGKETFRMYDFFLRYTDGHSFHQPYYVKDVQNYIINLSTLPEPSYPPTAAREILFSDMRSCMVIKNPKNPKVCNLMVTKEEFSTPPGKCLRKFKRHCGSPAFHYTINDCPYPEKKTQ
uniref:Putative lipocalin n=1 Tax=Ixodes ricinus TaxID=34613 RepID=A0A6B0UXN5_IXORI